MDIFDKKSRCYNGGKRHKYTPRYDEIESPHNISFRYNPYVDLDKIRRLSITNEYIYDICEWCGDIKIRIKNGK